MQQNDTVVITISIVTTTIDSDPKDNENCMASAPPSAILTEIDGIRVLLEGRNVVPTG